MTKTNFKKLNEETKNEYVKMLDLLMQVMHENKTMTFDKNTIKDSEMMHDANLLAKKFFDHAMTILHLSNRIDQKLPSFDLSRLDSASINVIARAAYETFLVFHHVLCDSVEPEEKEFRYLAYRVEGLKNKQRAMIELESIDPTYKIDIKNISVEITKIENKLNKNRIFNDLTKGQKNRIFTRNSMWRWNIEKRELFSITDVSKEVGFGTFMVNRLYGFLSASAHSSGVGVRQTLPPVNEDEETMIISGILTITNILIANQITGYCSLFPKSQAILDKDIDGKSIIKKWINRGRYF